ncbi:MAG TPA: diguanylate cyclase, partial [Miltoncostaeaceae bacterium]|nr:diguanylate cyclase [Miltoncostaeaceae bacterium]
VGAALLAVSASAVRPLPHGGPRRREVVRVAAPAGLLIWAGLHAAHALALAGDGRDDGARFLAWPLALWDALVVVAGLAGLVLWWRRSGPWRAGRPPGARDAARRRAAEQEALRRVAVAVAEERPAAEVLALVAREVAQLHDAECGLVTRFEDEGARVVGVFGQHESRIGTVFPMGGGAALARVARTGRAVRVEYGRLGDDPVAARVRGEGYHRGVAAPVVVGTQQWGAVLVATTRADGLRDGDLEERLTRFGELVALAIANAESRARLTELASTDPLTGLCNHRTFHDRLAGEVARARRHGTPLCVLVLDIDHFKAVNDAHGHHTGDRVLMEVARRLLRSVRADDVVARVGGEEFAVLLPGADERRARALGDRIARAVRTDPFPEVGRLTISGGVCELRRARDQEEMLRLADGALYWAKANGRDLVVVYSPDVVEALSAEERAEKLLRDRALAALGALARAVDAKDHTTREHSERVAELAVALGDALGWELPDVMRLREAGLLHDVGKIGVPDHILRKPGPLSDDEFAQVMEHASLGARIVAEVLDAEQVGWVRHHHERWDGHGYPDRLAAGEIAPGARILALADAWDAMTADRPYRRGMDMGRALVECRDRAGTQFAPEVVDALEGLARSGVLAVLTSPRGPVGLDGRALPPTPAPASTPV